MVKRMLKYFVSAVGVFLALAVTASVVKAATLENAYLDISDPSSAAPSVVHDFYFEVVGTTVARVDFRYCVTPSGDCTSQGNLGAAASLATVSDGGSAQTSYWQAYSSWTAPYWYAIRDEDISTTGGNQWRFRFTGMANPSFDTCTHNQPTNSSTGTCYVRIQMYSDTDGETADQTDNTIVSITVTRDVTVSAQVDPTFTLTVEGVAGTGQSINGSTITNELTTTITTIPFGNLTANTSKTAAHTLTVTGNNSGGYTVTAKMDGNLTGNAYGDDIDPYTGTDDNANTTTSQSWSSPDGTSSGTDTGWLGVGTDDTGVTNRGSNQFFSLGTTGTVVAESDGPSSARVSNVIYRIEANPYQQADSYAGLLTYDALPTY